MLWKLDNFARINKVKITIGKSVIIGARATLTPDLTSC
jgi:acetyltransferase-like isoleucine patch superfamily enzyme